MKKWHGVTKVACDHIIWRGHPRQGSDAINDHKGHTKKAKHEKRFKILEQTFYKQGEGNDVLI